MQISFEPVKNSLTYQDQYKHPNWQKLRLLILDRDNYTCVNCGEKHKTLHAHHLKYLKGRFIWEVPRWYIVTLCEECHSEEHGRDLTIGKKLDVVSGSFSCDACGHDSFYIVGLDKSCKLCGWSKSDGGK